tara:strand:- start:329 stop:1012 length:684 start_codon:yes stop_codon:yes gene_type:complete
MARRIAYLRVSTEEQVRSGLGLEAQREAIVSHQNGLDEVFTDDGYSGSDPNRPALHQAIDTLGEGDVLVVAKRDRLARDVYFSAWIEKEVKRRGARIISAAGEGTDNDDPSNVLMRTIVDAFAEYERNLISARTAAAMAQKRKRGEKTGGDVPFGYRLLEGGRLAVDPEEQKVLELIRKLREAGESYRKIGAELQRRGILTRRGKSVWNPQVVKNVLIQKTQLQKAA